MLGGKISLGLAIALVMVSSAFYIYYVDSQNTIQILQENVAKLDVAVETQKKTIETMKADFARQAKLANDLQTSLSKVEEDKNKLTNLLRKHNLEKILRDRPAEAEKKINNGTKRTFRQIEQDTTSK
jgi:hypothetical protein